AAPRHAAGSRIGALQKGHWALICGTTTAEDVLTAGHPTRIPGRGVDRRAMSQKSPAGGRGRRDGCCDIQGISDPSVAMESLNGKPRLPTSAWEDLQVLQWLRRAVPPCADAGRLCFVSPAGRNATTRASGVRC